MNKAESEKYKRIIRRERNELIEEYGIPDDLASIDRLIVTKMAQRYGKGKILAEMIKHLSHCKYPEKGLKGHLKRGEYRREFNIIARKAKNKRTWGTSRNNGI